MIAPIQNDILNKLIKGDKIKNIFDPFHGSGTALYEALEISNQIELIGCDISIRLSAASYPDIIPELGFGFNHKNDL